MKSWQKWRDDAILNFPKIYLISSYLGVKFLLHLSTFMLTKLKLLCDDTDCLIKCNFQFWKTDRSNTRLFSVGKETLSEESLSSPSFKCIV